MWKNVSVLVLSLVAAALVVEFAARVFFPAWAPRTGSLTQFWRYDPNYGWSHVPRAVGQFASYGFDTVVRINSEGFRGREVSQRKQPSKYRILVLGDSYVWGFGVEEEQIFTSQMERLCSGLDVLNFGVSGYSTDQELLLYKERGVNYSPDMVILVVASNDYDENTRSMEYVYYSKPVFTKAGDQFILTNRPVPQMNLLLRMAASVAQRSYVLTQLNRFIEGLDTYTAQTVSGTLPSKADQTHNVFPRTPGDQVTAFLLKEFVRAVHAAGATPVVVLSDGQAERGHELEMFIAEPEVTYVHLDESLRRESYTHFHLPGDFHWNAFGHAQVARSIVGALTKANKLPATACPAQQAAHDAGYPG